MKKLLFVLAIAALATGCEHVNFEFDWGTLIEGIVNSVQTKGETK